MFFVYYQGKGKEQQGFNTHLMRMLDYLFCVVRGFWVGAVLLGEDCRFCLISSPHAICILHVFSVAPFSNAFSIFSL